MLSSRTERRLPSISIAAPARAAAPRGRHPAVRRHVRRLLQGVAILVVTTLVAMTVFLGAGIVGTPWYRLVSIDGGSMAPTIARGDLAVLAPAPNHIEPG